MQTSHLTRESVFLPNHTNFIARVDAVVQQNLSNEDFCIADLQTSLLMSSSQIYRKIKEQTGVSPSVYVRTRRLEKAKVLIDQSDLSLSEISYKVGFNELSYFSRCFSKQYGMSPSTFRGRKQNVVCV